MRQFAVRTKHKFLEAPLYVKVFIVLLGSTVSIYLLTAFFGGGDAFQGHRTTDRFFFAHHDGAPEQEVSRFIYYLNLWDMVLLAVLWGIGLSLGVFDFLKKRFRSASN